MSFLKRLEKFKWKSKKTREYEAALKKRKEEVLTRAEVERVNRQREEERRRREEEEARRVAQSVRSGWYNDRMTTGYSYYIDYLEGLYESGIFDRLSYKNIFKEPKRKGKEFLPKWL